MKEKLLENKKKVLENLYLTVFAVFCLYFFMWTTTFWVSWPDCLDRSKGKCERKKIQLERACL